MKTKMSMIRAAVAVAAIAGLGACGGDVIRADNARLVIDASPAEPLELLVSTDFVMLVNESGTLSPVFLSVDTIALTGNYDQTYGLPGEEPGFYVKLYNPSLEPEQVRIRVFLDGSLEYDASANMADPGYLSYIYSTDSAGSNGL